MYYRVFIALILALVSINSVSAKSGYKYNRKAPHKQVRVLRYWATPSAEEIIQKSEEQRQFRQHLEELERMQQRWKAFNEHKRNHPVPPLPPIISTTSGKIGNMKVGQGPQFKVTSDTCMLSRSWPDFISPQDLARMLEHALVFQSQLLWDLKHPTMPGVSSTEPTSDLECKDRETMNDVEACDSVLYPEHR